MSLFSQERKPEYYIRDGHSADVVSVCYSPKGEVFASGDDDGQVGIWEAKTGKLIRMIEVGLGRGNAICFSSDGTAIVLGGYDALYAVDYKKGIFCMHYRCPRYQTFQN
jgi:WD40 repeat protein